MSGLTWDANEFNDANNDGDNDSDNDDTLQMVTSPQSPVSLGSRMGRPLGHQIISIYLHQNITADVNILDSKFVVCLLYRYIFLS